MKQIPIRLGPVALVLTVISICLTVMAILTFSTAGADANMADAFADSVQNRYALESEGQAFLQDADEMLASGGELTDLPDVTAEKGSVEKILEQEGYQLKIRLCEAGDSYTVDEWALSKKWEQKETINNLWQGF